MRTIACYIMLIGFAGNVNQRALGANPPKPDGSEWSDTAIEALTKVSPVSPAERPNEHINTL